MNIRTWIARRLGVNLTQAQMAAALDTSPATIKRRESEGYEVSEIIAAARHWGLNPAHALVDLDILTPEEVLSALGVESEPVGNLSDYRLAVELADRLRPE